MKRDEELLRKEEQLKELCMRVCEVQKGIFEKLGDNKKLERLMEEQYRREEKITKIKEYMVLQEEMKMLIKLTGDMTCDDVEIPEEVNNNYRRCSRRLSKLEADEDIQEATERGDWMIMGI